MSFFKIFDYRQWEPLDLEGFIVDGKLSDMGVLYAIFIAAGIGLAFA